MKMQVYAVMDEKVGAFMPPFYMRSRGEAIRTFTAAVLDEKGPFKFREDYTLYYLCVYDDATGQFTADGPPVRVFGALEVE